MKKTICLILLMFISVMFTGCFQTAVEPNENEITLYLEDQFSSYMKYEDIPTFTFKFNGNLNTVKNVKKPYYTVFSNNDDIILSDALNELFTKYKDRMYVEVTGSQEVSTTLFSKLNEYGALENDEYTPDDKKIYEETAYIMLENGLKLTVDYRHFVYEGKDYYTWKYSASITMWLYYPMMVIEENEEKELLIITLPNRITFQVGPQLTLSNVLNGVTYVYPNNQLRYAFTYLEELETVDEKQKYVRDYYVSEMSGTVSDDGKTIFYSYLGCNYSVILDEDAFTMQYLGKVTK